MKIQMASASQQQPQPPCAAVTESNGDAEKLLAPKTDLHELLQKQGEPSACFAADFSFRSRPLIRNAAAELRPPQGHFHTEDTASRLLLNLCVAPCTQVCLAA